MKKKGINKMWIIFGIFLAVLGVLMVYFNIPYSPTRSDFNQNERNLLSALNVQEGVYTEDDLAGLPVSVQNFYRHCGYIGMPRAAYGKIYYSDVAFRMARDKSPIKIDYTQLNTIEIPNRIALIDSSMYGIPFQGMDMYVNGTGRMVGVLGKAVTLFDVSGEKMDVSSLVTILAESALVPGIGLQDYVTWEEVDPLHAKAAISYWGISATGVFTFNEDGEMVSFTTDDRYIYESDNSIQNVRWSVRFTDYQSIDGIQRPTHIQIVWNYPDGDFVYFDSNNFRVEYGN